MKKTIAALLSCVLALLGLTACDGSNQVEEVTPPYPVTVANVTINERPKAVASITPFITDILLDLGYQNRIVGYPDERAIPDPLPEPEPTSSEEPAWWQFWVEESSAPVSDPAPSDTDHIGTTLEPDFEKVGELKPEIIFTGVPFSKAQMDKLDQVNIKVIVMPTVTTVEELKTRYLEIIQIMDGQQEADTLGLALSDSIQSSFDFIQAQAASAPGGLKTFLYVNSLDPLITTGDSYEGRLLSLIGTNLAESQTAYTVDAETLAGYDPDVILYTSPLTPEAFAGSELFKDKKAVTEGNLIEIDISSLLLQTRAAADSLRAAAEKLYPGTDFTQPEPVSSDVSGESGQVSSGAPAGSAPGEPASQADSSAPAE